MTYIVSSATLELVGSWMDGWMNLLRSEALGLKGTGAIIQSIASCSSVIVSQKPIHMLLSLLSGVNYGLISREPAGLEERIDTLKRQDYGASLYSERCPI